MTASRKAPLRAVQAGEKPKPRRRRPQTILQAAEAGSRLDELMAMRRRIAKALDDFATPARDLAALSRRQLEISREIEAIHAADKGDEIGDAAAAPDEQWDQSAI